MKIHVQRFEWTQVLITLGYIPRVEYGIAGSYGNFIFNNLKNCQSVLQSSCNILHFHKQCVNVCIYPHSWQHLLLSVFFITIILVGMQWYIIFILFYISKMTNDVEYLFMCLLVIFISILEKSLLMFLPVYN